jgi:hypothetical protein
MNPADEEAAKLVPTDQRPGAVAGSPDDLEEQLHATLKQTMQRICMVLMIS